MKRALIVLLVAQVAQAEPKKQPLSDADQKAVKEALAKGRKLESKKSYTAALAAFDEALKISPDDSTVLAEAGFTAYLAKDLEKAEAMTRKALANEGEPSVRGAAFYNLGLIEEARKDTKAEIAAYSESLRVRPNGSVRAALTKLDPAAASAFDPYKPAKLDGPFDSIDAFCKTRPVDPEYPADELDCKCSDPSDDLKVTPLPKPFEHVSTFTYACTQRPPLASEPYGYDDYFVGVKVAAKWSFERIAHHIFNRHCNENFKFNSSRVQDLAVPAVVVEFSAEGDCYGQNDEVWKYQGSVVIGVGPSKTPSGTPPIFVKRSETMQSMEITVSADRKPIAAPVRTVVDLALELAWTRAGVEVSGKTKGVDKGEATNILGKHALVFP